MQKQTKRVQKIIAPKKEVELLIRALNRDSQKEDLTSRDLLLQLVPDSGRLAGVVLKLQRLVVRPPDSLEQMLSKELHEIDMTEIWKELGLPDARHLKRLNDELRQYITFPQIEWNGEVWRFKWEVAYSSNLDSTKGGVIDARRVAELPLLLTAISLAEQGLIDRVRRCPVDRRWFFARTRDSRFCGTKCRHIFHQRDPNDKERRRTWARENYQARKTLEAGSITAANQRTIRKPGRKSK